MSLSGVQEITLLLTLSLLAATLSSASNLCKQFGPNHDRQNVGPDLRAFLKVFFENVNFEKSQQTTTKA